MKVRLAESAGFCYGVERAVNAVYDEVEKKSGKIYTYGPIVHNDIVVNELAAKGVEVIEDLDELQNMSDKGELHDTTVIIRAHGQQKNVTDLQNSEKCCAHLVDATCPLEQKKQETENKAQKNGEKIIVTGTATHPEVVGILGQIGADATVIENVSDAENVKLDENAEYCLVSQTTFNVHKFKDIVAILKKKSYHVNVVDTICNATQLRQKEARELSRECDAVIVIGGRHSSNASKLYDICSKECSMTYFIESLQDFTEKKLDSSVRCVGITAGASTPKTIIQEVLSYVRDEF